MEPIEWIAFAIMAALEVGGAIWKNHADKQAVDEERSWNEKMVDESNDYNSPENQMKRMQAAGINTAMMGESGASSIISGSRSASPLSNTLLPMTNPFSQFGGSASQSFSAYAKGKSDLTLLEAQKEQIIENTQKLRAEVANLELSSEAQAIANKYADARELWAINGMKSNVRLSYAQQAHFNQLIKESEYNLTNVLPEELKKIVSERNKNVMDLEVMLATIKDYEASADYKKSQTELAGKQGELLAAQTAQTQAQTSQTEVQTDMTEQELSNLKSISDRYVERYGAEIENIKAQTGLTTEQAYWHVYDVQARLAPSNKISALRFGYSSDVARVFYSKKYRKFSSVR